MLFSVIYSADCPRSESIARFRPPQARKLWDTTESDEGYDYGYLEGDWEKRQASQVVRLADQGAVQPLRRSDGLGRRQH